MGTKRSLAAFKMTVSNGKKNTLLLLNRQEQNNAQQLKFRN